MERTVSRIDLFFYVTIILSRNMVVIRDNYALNLKIANFREKSGKEEETFESADFPSHMEPMMLACICNKYEIILLMLQKGYRLEISMGDSKDKSKIMINKEL